MKFLSREIGVLHAAPVTINELKSTDDNVGTRSSLSLSAKCWNGATMRRPHHSQDDCMMTLKERTR